ncbi:hypothetical protein N656DRAFT_699532 [Canariomyces notabilis]|uniref:Alpha box domain-containing protein n=1 Tax=Canariomyces notabilis TaxID=2074819 RepID=A0AAN6TNB2_9PEZI|nr:hypothetical protein N656DRAFT_699532 [Canariomyces arenarius]
MSGVNQIIQTFEGLGNGDRETAMRALTTMMQSENQRSSTKKKVNGFMGFRAYYSALFTQFTQAERSPIMTMLWQQDPFHKEWDFMCGVYSAIRDLLEDQNISLQDWIQAAVKPLGIVARDSYLATLGWEMVQLEDGTNTLQRGAAPPLQSSRQPMNVLGLFTQCLNEGLQVVNPGPIVAKLIDAAKDVICINSQPGGDAAKTFNTMDGFRRLAQNNPQLTMSALFDMPLGNPIVSQGITTHYAPDGMPADAMLDSFLRYGGSKSNYYIVGTRDYTVGDEGKSRLFLI